MLSLNPRGDSMEMISASLLSFGGKKIVFPIVLLWVVLVAIQITLPSVGGLTVRLTAAATGARAATWRGAVVSPQGKTTRPSDGASS